jgi:predicted nucleic acid-binding protein
MSGKRFFDTNIFVYTLEHTEPRKRQMAHDLLVDCPRSEGVISYQVMQEFCNVCLRKFAPQPRPERIHTFLLGMLEQYEVVGWSPLLMPQALEIHYRYKYHWYDSLMIAAALFAKCSTFYSEDMQHGQVIEGMTIVNPFV